MSFACLLNFQNWHFEQFKATDWVFHTGQICQPAMFGATLNLVTCVGLP